MSARTALLTSAILLQSACGGEAGNDEATSGILPTGAPTTASASTSSSTDDSGSMTGGEDASDDEGSADTTGGSDPGGPQVLTFLANPMEIGEGGFATFTAQVTDPNGLEDIVGGTIKSADGLITYFAFQQVSGGTFETVLTWDQLHGAEAINFTSMGTRTLRAEFLDNSGSIGWKTLDLGLTCNGLAACNGVCTNIGINQQNCGGCGIACTGTQVCTLNGCVTPELGECVAYEEMTCDQWCALRGKTCVSNGCDGSTHYVYDYWADCDAFTSGSGAAVSCGSAEQSIPGGFVDDTYQYIRCCCG